MKSSILLSIAFCWIFSSCTKDKIPTTQLNPLPQPVAGLTYSANEVTAFKQLTINATHTIAKLPKHVSIYLVDTTYPHMTSEIDLIISKINILLDTNLVLTRTRNRAGSLIQVYLTDRNTYLTAEPQASRFLQNSDFTGLGFIDRNGGGEISHSSIFVDMVRTGNDMLQQRYIIHHETMHALGFLGHVSLVEFSYSIMFNFAVTPYRLDYSSFDNKMMRLLYNPAIKAGMNEASFNAAVVNL